MLKWARENNCSMPSFAFEVAAWKGHLEILKWAKENGLLTPGLYGFGKAAARGGHLAVLKWVKENELQEYPGHTCTGAITLKFCRGQKRMGSK